MYSANIISINPQADGTSKIEVQFTNGATTTPSEYVVPADATGLQYFIQQRLNALNFTPPAVGPYTPPTPTITPPTQAEIDYANFAKWLNLTIALSAAKNLGWITGNEPIVTNIKNQVMALANTNLPKLFS